MLVIRRKREQVIHIGADIEVTVLEIENGQVKLGINAPRDVPVFREEIAATRRSNQGAVLAEAAFKALETYTVPNSSGARTVSISSSSS